MALRLDLAGADGLVLFNRFLHPDIDPETLTVEPGVTLSTPQEARLPRTWIAILHGHVPAPSPRRPGSRRADDVAAYLLAGADVVMTASALLRHGARTPPPSSRAWRTGSSARGSRRRGRARAARRAPGADPTAYERAGYVAALERDGPRTAR